MTDYSAAACARSDVDPEIFFRATADELPGMTHDQRSSFNKQRTREAQRICASCPLQQTCLDEHLTEGAGVWGGKTLTERQAIAAERGVTWDDDEAYIDEIAIERAMIGDPVKLDRPTRLELIRRLDAYGYGYREIAAIARANTTTMREARSSQSEPQGLGQVA